MKIITTGSTGFIGRELFAHLTKNRHNVTALVRNQIASKNLSTSIANQDAIINLAGEPIASGRWTKEKKKKIYDSRINTTRQIIHTIENLPHDQRPKVLVNASAVGIYSNDFLATVATDWEKEALKAESLGVRVVLLRFGIVLGRNGGALSKMQPVILGDGSQWMSWIHLHDVVNFIDFAMTKNHVHGPYDLTSPNPEQNSTFTRKFAKARGFSFVLKFPAFLLKLVMGEMSILVLSSLKVFPEKALKDGFTFMYPTLESALNEIYSN